MNSVYRLIEKLKNPDREFTPIPFWFLNDDFSDDEIIRQMKDFNNKGVHGVVPHPRMGIPESIEYLSDRFMHFMEVIVKTARELDMKVVLYDEAMYPSGSAHGLVVKDNPEFASQAIILADDANAGKLISKTRSGKYIVQIESMGTMRGVHFGEDDLEDNAPRSADLLNPDAVKKFVSLTHERYYSLMKDYFGSTIIGFFTDEPCVTGRNPVEGCKAWTWGFEDVITARGGNLEELEGLFTGESNKTVEIYNKAIFERENDTYYKTLSEWCKNHGIALMGHPHRGDDIELQQYFHIPGQDVVLRWIAPEKNAMETYESAQAKCSSDAARCTGKRRNSNECYGACCKDNIPWNFSGGDLKWYTDWLGVRGVNLFIPHAFYYSVRDARKDERPPDVGPNNIWWKYFNVISTYIKRISCLMTDSANMAKVCVLCENRKMPIDEMVWFYQNQVEFNYVPYSSISDDCIKNGKLEVGNNEYEYVFNNYRKLYGTVKEITDYSLLAHRDIYTDIPCKDLRVSHIMKDGVEVFFLVNEGENNIKTHASVKGKGSLVAMDFWTGYVNNLPCVQKGSDILFELNLKRRESVLILIDKDGECDNSICTEKEYIKPQFELLNDDKREFVKYYKAVINSDVKENLYISIKAEEMVECFVNGKLAGFSLWNDHEFYISPYLVNGENTIELRVTGSAVNRFTQHTKDYGLIQE